MAPPTIAAKPAGGVLPISAVQIQPNGSTAKAQASQPRSKVVIRRLAPGLTQTELQDALGEEWLVGKGRVDWMLFRPGKVSKDLAKPSRPSRVYLQIMNPVLLESLAEKVRNTPFTDARNTAGDAVLIGPPTLEFAPYGRVPASKRRNDARLGLIDQDPEFIQFLESLTNPITKPVASDTNLEHADRKDTAPTVTPLILHLREKKAAKEAAKEKSSAAKAAKHTRQGSKNENTETKVEAEAPAPSVKDASKIPEKKPARVVKSERAAKIISKPAKADGTESQAKSQVAPRGSPQITKAIPEVTKAVPESSNKKVEAVNPGTAAARMLQRDLGIRGGRGGSVRRGARQASEQNQVAANPADTISAITPVEKGSGSNLAVTKSTTSTPTDSTSLPPALAKPPTAPAIMKRNAANKQPLVTAIKTNQKPTSTATTSATTNSTTTSISSVPTMPPPNSEPTSVTNLTPPLLLKTPKAPLPIISSTSTKAFLKHANPSQGITEPLLHTALSAFGQLTSVEIDKRKGFAYVEFADPDGLRKAIAASPVKVAQGNVQVLERKDRVGGGNVTGRGGAVAAGVVGVGGSPVAGVGGGAIVGTGRGAVAGRGVAGVVGRGGAAVVGQVQQQQQQQQPQQQQPFRGARGGGTRGRGGIARGGSAPTSAPTPASTTTDATSPSPAAAAAAPAPTTITSTAPTAALPDTAVVELAPTIPQTASADAITTMVPPTATAAPKATVEATAAPTAPLEATPAPAPASAPTEATVDVTTTAVAAVDSPVEEKS